MLINVDNLLNPQIKPPSNLLPWLVHQSSLTNKLKALADDVQLEVLMQHWVRPNWWDKFTLGLQVSSVMHRDILISAQQQPCWYARTIVPESSFQTCPSFFARLKHESLGDIIFNEPTVNRKQMVYYAINQQSLEYYWLSSYFDSHHTEFWSRLSVFTIDHGSPFYLLEVLLPGLLRIIN